MSTERFQLEEYLSEYKINPWERNVCSRIIEKLNQDISTEDIINYGICHLSPGYVHLLEQKLGYRTQLIQLVTKTYDKILDNLVFTLDKTQILTELYDQNKNLTYKALNMTDITYRVFFKTNFIREILSKRFFNQTSNNLFTNYDELVNFYQSYSDKLTQKENEKFNQFFKTIELMKSCQNTSIDHIRKIYRQLQQRTKTYYQRLYHHVFETAKRIANEELCKANTEIASFPCEIKQGVKIYQVGKQPFKFFIKMISSCFARDDELTTRYVRSKIYSTHDTASISFVSDDCLYTYHDLKKYICLGIEKIAPKTVAYISEYDNYNTFDFFQNEPFSREKYCLCTPNELLERTKRLGNYNEINLIHRGSMNFDTAIADNEDPDYNIEHAYILSLNEITKPEMELARRLDLPIVYIENEKYQWRGMADPRKFDVYDKISEIEFDI